jgi:hypothetical protein
MQKAQRKMNFSKIQSFIVDEENQSASKTPNEVVIWDAYTLYQEASHGELEQKKVKSSGPI